MAKERGGPLKLEFIPVWDLEQHWAAVAPLLAKALATQSGMSLESIQQDIKRLKFHLWRIADKAAFVTEIQQFPCEKIAMIVLCGGEGLDAWMHIADETLTRYAKALGCAAVMIVGRPGWSKVLPAYRITDFVMRKQL